MGEIRKKGMPIGISDYKNLIDENTYYVDKTLFVKDIIDDSAKVLVLTRPRRFGKTLNLSMLYYYFSNSGDDNSYLFKDKKIFQQEQKYISEQGKYPVIYITLKDVKESTYEKTFEHRKTMLSYLSIDINYYLYRYELS